MPHFRLEIEARVVIEADNETEAIEQVNDGSWDGTLHAHVLEIEEFEEPSDLGPAEFPKQRGHC